jgi:hypothetical protein
VGAAGVLTVSIPMPVIDFTLLQGAVGTLTFSIPVPEISLSGNLSAEGTLSITIPMQDINLASFTATNTYLNMVLNIRNQALTLYTNYPFNSMCRFNGVHLGATSTKIHNLESGENDDGTLIDWNIRLPYFDLEQKMKRRITHVWLSYKSSGDFIATIITPSGDEWEYPVEAVNTTENGIRVTFGKGIKSKYVALDVKNTDGSDIDLDTIRIQFDQFNKKR